MSKLIKKKRFEDEFESYLAQNRPNIVYKPKLKSYNFNELWQEINKKD